MRSTAVFLLLLFGLIFEPAAAQSLTEAETTALFQEANLLFREANETSPEDPEKARDLYQRAVVRFERLVRDGHIRNGKLYYNIGNAYFRLDDLGRAILNYLRAGKDIPNDTNLIQNLKYARSRRVDKFEERQTTRVLKTLLFWHYDLSYGVRLSIFIVVFLALWAAAALRLLKKELVPDYVMIIFIIVAVLFLSSVIMENYYQRTNRTGVIIAAEIIARKGDGNSFQPSFKDPLHCGVEFLLIEKRSGWLQIELPDGRRCWIPEKAAEFVW